MRAYCFFVLAVLAAVLGGSGGLAQMEDHLPAAPLGLPETCLQRLEVLVSNVTRLQTTITNDAARLDCVNDRLAKLKGLLALTRTSVTLIQVLEKNAESDENEIDAEKAKILVALTRAEKAVAEAVDCQATLPAKPRKHKTKTVAGEDPPKLSSAPVAVPSLPPVTMGVRSANGCLPQGDTARMLAQAMELVVDARDTGVACAELSRAGIEPPGGWERDKCTTVEDFYIVIAKALNLETNTAPDAAHCGQVLRAAGLPVDTFLPPSVEGRTMPLYESEVRAFLTTGRAGRPGR